ncbi:MAG: hypothetical protein EBS21_10130 [Sphingomonadaceae bacterium]|nr:hypothetical protein [Sphingomonadaceae bacterium]
MTTIDSGRLMQMRTAILNQNAALQRAAGTGAPTPADTGPVPIDQKGGFGASMVDALKAVNDQQAKARGATEAYERGETQDLVQVMVALLYEELILALSLLAHAFRVGDQVKANGQFSRAATIINALEAGLDVERGGPLAETLAGVYRSARREIMQARTDQDSDRLDRLIAAFSDMSESWKKIAA